MKNQRGYVKGGSVMVLDRIPSRKYPIDEHSKTLGGAIAPFISKVGGVGHQTVGMLNPVMLPTTIHPIVAKPVSTAVMSKGGAIVENAKKLPLTLGKKVIPRNNIRLVI